MKDLKSWTISELLRVTTDYLKKKGIDSPRLSAEILLAHQLDLNRVKLYLDFDRPLQDEEVAGFRLLVRRRLNREPIQYITGIQEFWSLAFTVAPPVLIPRPESELLVEEALSLIGRKNLPGDRNPKILDLGTGSGALAISLAKEVKGIGLWASDISEEALRIARLNACKHGVEDRIVFSQGDLWEPFAEEGLTFDLVLSNPPYIDSGSFDSLPPEVRDHEPRTALDGGEGGMLFIERIIREGPDFLERGGWLLVEMDPDQTTSALTLIEESGQYSEQRRIKDYSHRYRVVVARKKP